VKVINAANINKMKNYLSFSFTEHKTKGEPRHMTLEIQVLAWDRHNNMWRGQRYTWECVVVQRRIKGIHRLCLPLIKLDYSIVW